ncbi:MAG: hypothetical protein C0598_04165 [Marinilabiliales bacterium]|nr:MAG: hypothetical protein C0598_04165 [Marinilabiliales bacterium]
MKKLNLLFAIILITITGYTQSDWHAQNSGVNNYLFDVHFVSQSEGWIAGNTGLILHTSDGGETWENQQAPANNTYYGIFFADEYNGWACGFGGKIINTNDGGQTWSIQNPGSSEFLYDIFFLDENIGWAVGGDGGSYPSFISQREILHTTDGGLTWSHQLNQSHESPLKSVHFSSMDNGYAVGESGTILHTTDGGQTWAQSISEQSYHMYDVFTTNSNTAYVIGYYLGLPHVPAIFNTKDGGQTWNSQTFSEDISLSSIHFSDEMNGWAAGGQNGSSALLKTDNGGESWEYDYPNSGDYLVNVFCFDNAMGWAVGANGTVLTTASFFTGFEEISQNNEISIYPNPATSFIKIKMDDVSENDMKLNIINMSGQLIYESRHDFSTNQEIIIPVNDIPNGIYQLVISNSSRAYTEKVIIR